MSLLSFTLPPAASNALAIGSKLLAYLNNPSITFQGTLENAGPFNTATVRLDCEKYEEDGDAEISQLLLLDAEGTNGEKRYVTDNIAPRPKTWNISGYISDPTEILQSAILAVPGGSVLQNVTGVPAGALGLQYTLSNYILNAQATILWNCFYSRQLVKFTDRNHKPNNVGIAKLTISVDPVIRNKLRFSMTLKQIILYSQYKKSQLDNSFTNGPNLGNTPYSFLQPAESAALLTPSPAAATA